MKSGIQISRFKWPGGDKTIAPKLAEVAKISDDAGFDSLWVMDHFFQLEPMLGPVDDPMLEGYSVLSFLAGLTKNVQLGTLVSGVIYREPALLVKTVTTLDILSGGRAIMGIGTGWYEREALGLGFLNPLTSKRFERLEETLQIIKQMWRDDRSAYEGKYYQLDEPICSPQPLSDPNPPIMIGGGGEKRTLKMVAQYGDACNVFAWGGTDEVSHKFQVLKQHCQDVGRDYDEIEKTVMMAGKANSVKDAKAVVAYARELAEIGVQHIIFTIPGFNKIKPLEIFGNHIIPELKKF